MCVCGIHDYQSAGKNAGRGNSEVSLTQREARSPKQFLSAFSEE